MTTVVRFGRRAYDGTPLLAARVTESLTEGSSSAATTITARRGEIAEITALSADVYAHTGAAASSEAFTVAVPAGGTGFITDMQDGATVTIITV